MHLVQLHQPTVLAELDRLEARLLVVSFAPPERLEKWVPYFKLNFLEAAYREQQQALPGDVFRRTRFLTDPDRAAYHAYGLGRNRVWQVYGPGILWQYLRWFLQGRKIKKPAEDPLQRGGDFVINRAGRIVLAHTGRDQSDRPPVEAILEALRQQ